MTYEIICAVVLFLLLLFLAMEFRMNAIDRKGEKKEKIIREIEEIINEK
jgi:hypothetical protein